MERKAFNFWVGDVVSVEVLHLHGCVDVIKDVLNRGAEVGYYFTGFYKFLLSVFEMYN